MQFSIRTSILFLFIFTSISGFAQTAKITGKIIIENSDLKASDCKIKLTSMGRYKETRADSNGNFEFDKLGAGVYKVRIEAPQHDTISKSGIRLENGNVFDLGDIRLKSQVTNFKRFKKTTTAKVSTVTAAITDVKKNDVVSNIISTEDIKKSQASDAAKVAASVPGVTLMENRFIMLRGLSQRYNSVQINGINAPSTEVDKRAFSFDLVPSSMLDRLEIFKSPSGELAGDFSGGNIRLQTKGEKEADFYNYSIGIGYRYNTTFTNRENNSVGSSTDYLGFDNGNRSLPSGFPSSLADYGTAKAIEFGKTLRNNYELNTMRVPIDFGGGFGFGKNIKLKKGNLFTINNFGYSTNFQYTGSRRNRYQFNSDPNATDPVTQMFNYNDDNLSVESKFNLLSNWIYSTKNTNIKFRNLYNQIGENETTIRTGINPSERPNDEFKNYSYHYTSRSLFFSQLEVTQKVSKLFKYNYVLGYSNIKRSEPDYRRFRTYRAANSNDPYKLIDPPSASLFDAARFYSNLNENTFSGSLNFEQKFSNLLDSNRDMTLKYGVYAESKARTFKARWISYSYTGDPMKKNDFLVLPVDQIFAAENLNSVAGFKPQEGTNPNDKYTAGNQLAAGYVQYAFPYKKMKINAGVRGEYFNQVLNSATQNGKVDVKLTNFNILPSLNVSYFFDSAMNKSLIRLGYGRTVNRPEFRELAPFVYYDFVYDVNIVGNPDLKSATIDNLDVRYEYYPSSSETVSFGTFYKRFVNPIENYVQPIGLSQQFTMKNAAKANNFGVELEVRKSFANATQNPFFKKLSTYINASYIYSRVDLGKDSTLSQARNRPLQGQSPYIINGTLQYQNDSTNLTVSIAYNIIGKRIYYVGNSIFPTVYEMPRHSLDLTVIKKVSRRVSVKFGVSDILNYKSQLWQDTNGDGKIQYKGNKDHQILAFRRGQMFSFGLSYTITEDKK